MTDVIPVNLVDEMKKSYLDYSMAVICGRAIPDLYDGLKPVTRRVLTAMQRLNLRPDAKYMKAARVSGDTMGRYHPSRWCIWRYGYGVTTLDEQPPTD